MFRKKETCVISQNLCLNYETENLCLFGSAAVFLQEYIRIYVSIVYPENTYTCITNLS